MLWSHYLEYICSENETEGRNNNEKGEQRPRKYLTQPYMTQELNSNEITNQPQSLHSLYGFWHIMTLKILFQLLPASNDRMSEQASQSRHTLPLTHTATYQTLDSTARQSSAFYRSLNLSSNLSFPTQLATAQLPSRTRVSRSDPNSLVSGLYSLLLSVEWEL